MASRESERQARLATPMMAQYQRLKEEHQDALLMFRLGDFYELFGEDAKVAAPILDVQLTSRDGVMPMCGVPHHALMNYLQRLIKAGKTVALAEQMEDPRQAKGLVERQVVRVFSPGTFITEDSIETPRFAVFYRDARGVALAMAELATGMLFVCEADANLEDQVREEWSSWHPDETLANWVIPEESGGRQIEGEHWFRGIKSGAALERELAERLGTASLSSWGLESAMRGQKALAVLIRYLDFSQKRRIQHWSAVQVVQPRGGMRLSPHALTSLDVIGDGQGPDLYGVLNQTRTPMGARRLEWWLRHPLVDREAIGARSQRIQTWQANALARAAVVEALGSVGDMGRKISRLSLDLGFPRDLIALRTALWSYHTVVERARALGDEVPDLDSAIECELEPFLGQLADPAPARWDAGNLFAEGVDAALDRARSLAQDHRSQLAALEQRERDGSGIRSVKIGYHRAFGYFLEVSRSQLEKVPAHWHKRQTMTKSERYTSDDLLALEVEILESHERSLAMEREKINLLLTKLTELAAELNRAAEYLAELDVVTALAGVAQKQRWVWPGWNEENIVPQFWGLRHAVLDTVIADYVPTDFVPDRSKRLIVMTGANMGGKSTFMRALALAVWLAQMGMAVPAERALMGVLDGIYTRIGADDHLFRGQSTFMAELEDVALILRRASTRSLVLLDELGRGTSTYDGLAIASAVVDYLAEDPGPLTLFATHYHELTGLAERRSSVQNWTTEVVTQPDGSLTFSHRMLPGAADRSYGLDVARLAGLPRSVLEKAHRAMSEWQSLPIKPYVVEPGLAQARDQHAIALKKALLDLDLDELSPRQAWLWLAEWKARTASED